MGPSFYSNKEQEQQVQPCKQGHAHPSAMKLRQFAEAASYLLCVHAECQIRD